MAPALIRSPIRFMMKGEVEATMLKEPYITLTEKKGCRTICSAFYQGTGLASDKVDTETYKAFNRGMRASAPDQTDVRLRSDEPKADQHQHAGQGGEQEAIGNAGRQVATD
jgi:hypothetical protein